MGLTRGNILDRVTSIMGENSTEFRTYVQVSLDNMLYYLWDVHDWVFKHKEGSFTTIASTETYDLIASTPDLRSSQDIELIYNITKGNFLNKVNLREIKINYPKEQSDGDPIVYAPWGTTTIHLHSVPKDADTLKYLYISTPTLPTQDTDDLSLIVGLPPYAQYLLEKLVLAEAMLYIDENRYRGLIEQVERLYIPRAIQADMKHLDSDARMKFWEEELRPNGQTFDDFLRNQVFNFNRQG